MLLNQTKHNSSIKNLLFMGTSDFGVPILEEISKHKDIINITHVYTKEPKRSGRGNKIKKTPIHTLAEQLEIPILTPKSIKTLNPPENTDLILVVAYGLFVPPSFISQPKYGCINIHPSKLPDGRGPSPIQNSIINGHNETALTIMFLDDGMDSGNIISQFNIKILEDDDIHSLKKKLIMSSVENIMQTIQKIFNKTNKSIPQDHQIATFTKKITNEDMSLNFNEDCVLIYRKIKAFTPDAHFVHKNNLIKIISAKYQIFQHNKIPGHVEILDNQLFIFCQNGAIIPLIIQREGKKPMETKSFLTGYKI